MKIVQDMQRRDQGYIDERIREIATEIAREEFRASKNDEWPWMDHPEKWDAMKREARDSALEEAAAYVAGKGRSKDASEIRSLKSQPAAPNCSMEGVEAAPPLSYYGHPAVQAYHERPHGIEVPPAAQEREWAVPSAEKMEGVSGDGSTLGESIARILSVREQPAAQASAPQIVGTSCVGWADPLKHEALLLENSELRKERDDLRAKLTAAEKAIKDAYDAVPFGWRDEDGYRYLKAVLLILSEHLRIGRKEESK